MSRVNCCAKVHTCKQVGKKAILNQHKSKIDCSSKRIEYSINIDDCCKEMEPQSNRWDYVLACNDECFFIEAHPAESPKHIREVYEKFMWIKNKLAECGYLGKKLTFYWLATGEIDLRSKNPRSKRNRQLQSLNRSIKGPEKYITIR